MDRFFLHPGQIDPVHPLFFFLLTGYNWGNASTNDDQLLRLKKILANFRDFQITIDLLDNSGTSDWYHNWS